MNLYGCIPASYFPAHSTLTYWAQAASLASLPTSDSAFTSATLALSLKKNQPPLSLNDVIQKNRSIVSLRSPDHLTSSFRVPTRDTSPPCDTAVSLNHHGHIQLHTHLRHRQQHQNHHYLQHRPFSASPPPVGNGLAPLQALCDSDVSAFTAKTSAVSSSSASTNDSKGSLKFGMSRILSDDFGKTKNEKENSFQLSNVPESCRSLPLCPCNSATCTAYTHPSSPYPRGALPSLSAVHALQPPNYPLSSSADALPGPYSILSTDSSPSNQPKRKRSWSRAVFSNLQRKGLEKRFEVQKYVTKPDRRQLAAMLGLTDAQVKVWFQNRRMKWRHAQQQGEKDKQIQQHQDEQTQQEQQKQTSLQIKKDDVSADRESEKTSNNTGSGFTINDVHSHTVTAHNTRDLISPVAPPERLTTKIQDNLALGISTSRGDSSLGSRINPRSYTPGCASDHCINISEPCQTRIGLQSTQSQRTSDLMVPHDVTPRSNDVMVSPLRHQVRSPSSGVDDAFDDGANEHLMDSDDDSRSGLEIDSDVDVNGDDDDEIPDHMKCTGIQRGEQDSGHFDADISMKEIDVDT